MNRCPVCAGPMTRLDSPHCPCCADAARDVRDALARAMVRARVDGDRTAEAKWHHALDLTYPRRAGERQP